MRLIVPVTIAVVAMLLAGAAARAEDGRSLEYAVKATFVYKFAPFVTWPAAAHGTSAFPICVSGTDRVSPLIATVVRGQQIDGKPITVRPVKAGGDMQGCAILYIASADTRSAQHLLADARGKPILTITDDGEDAAHGIIDFRVLGGHVRFDIDQSLATEAGLTISSKLLNLASAVHPRPQP